jgi:spore maturation protein SpmA/spore maturation protein SpmB
MLNFIWLGLILVAVILGGLTGSLDAVTLAAFKAAETAVMSLALPLIGLMAIWLGIMRIAEKAGLIQVLARALRPVMTRLFPEVPPEHPAMGAMLLNMGANMLGLANAATPLGLKAMAHLEKLNRTPGTASNAMCTFLAINTSSIQLIPATTVAYLAAAKATDPTWIIGPAFLATLASTIVAVAVVKWLARWPQYRNPPTRDLVTDVDGVEPDTVPEVVPPLIRGGWLVLLVYFGLFAYFGYMLVSAMAPIGFWKTVVANIKAISTLAVPFLLSFFPLYASLRRIPVYEEFVEGAKEGFGVATRIIPFLVAILVAIGMIRAAFTASAKFGWFTQITDAISRGLTFIGVPPDLLPLILLRPLSGSGSSGIFNELIRNPAVGGPDGLVARTAGVLMGSSETTFYVIAVYFGSVAIRRTRHALPAGLLADLMGVITAIWICRLMMS